jgi:UDP-N-acetylmuramate--alanine ligase
MGLDHTDFYRGQSDYNAAFVEFLGNTTQTIVIDSTKGIESDILSKLNKNIAVQNINKYRQDIEDLKLPIPGEHNKENFLRAYTTALVLGIDRGKAIKAMLSFPGLSKRFELAGSTPNGNLLYKDYAHNPPKIESLIKTTKQTFPDRKTILVWQPHSTERTYTFRKEFAEAIRGADKIFLTNIFNPVREPEELRNLISSEAFYQELSPTNKNVFFTGDLAKTAEEIKKLDSEEKNLVFVLASAGDLHTIAKDLVS